MACGASCGAAEIDDIEMRGRDCAAVGGAEAIEICGRGDGATAVIGATMGLVIGATTGVAGAVLNGKLRTGAVAISGARD